MLSWRSAATVEHTLASYARERIFDLFDDVLIYFQQISDADRALARRHGVRCDGNDANRGIYGGVKALLERLDTDYVLLVENDCVLIEPREEVRRQLSCAVADLAAGRADLYRFRHRREPGQRHAGRAKYRRYHLSADPAQRPDSPLARLAVHLRRWLRPAKARRLLGMAAYAEDRPDLRHPGVFHPAGHGNYIVRSRHIKWTNQSILVPRHWMLDTLLPYVAANPSSRTVAGFSDIEKELDRRWWRRQEFNIGIAPGLFTHHRLDR